jgi:hypothetical protein
MQPHNHEALDHANLPVDGALDSLGVDMVQWQSGLDTPRGDGLRDIGNGRSRQRMHDRRRYRGRRFSHEQVGC